MSTIFSRCSRRTLKPTMVSELAVLRVYNNVLFATDSSHCVILVLSNLSAAFNTVDRQILLSLLENYRYPGWRFRLVQVLLGRETFLYPFQNLSVFSCKVLPSTLFSFACTYTYLDLLSRNQACRATFKLMTATKKNCKPAPGVRYEY